MPKLPRPPLRHSCPRCHGTVLRVPQRFVDRLVSLFRPQQRYSCRSFQCQWEGNLSARITALPGHYRASETRPGVPLPPGPDDRQRR